MAARRRPEFGREAPGRLADLASSLHDVMEQMLVVHEGDPELEADLAWATQTADAIKQRLARHGRGRELHTGEGDDGRHYYVRGALVGPHHPMHLPIEIETRDHKTVGRVSFDLVWEGPPGCVHGGYVSYLYDCIMGHHNIECGIPGMTGTLTVRYRKPTPLYTDLEFEVTTVRSSGRKILDHAEVRAGDTLLSEADGLFILPRNLGDGP